MAPCNCLYLLTTDWFCLFSASTSVFKFLTSSIFPESSSLSKSDWVSFLKDWTCLSCWSWIWCGGADGGRILTDWNNTISSMKWYTSFGDCWSWIRCSGEDGGRILTDWNDTISSMKWYITLLVHLFSILLCFDLAFILTYEHKIPKKSKMINKCQNDHFAMNSYPILKFNSLLHL